MVIIGTLLVIAITWILLALLGEMGLILVGALAFGFLFSVYMKVDKLNNDIQLVKEKLGVMDTGNVDSEKLEELQNMNLKNEDIEKELEEALEKDKVDDER